MPGYISAPATRAEFASLPEWLWGELAAGKFFPATKSGGTDRIAESDVASAAPPADGRIASAGRAEAFQLDEPGTHWQKHHVASGETLDVQWRFPVSNPTRRWSYFITKQNWNPFQPLARSQFDTDPFHSVELTPQPYWTMQTELTPSNPTTHQVPLPQRTGYHVLLATWEIADRGDAIYQVIDLDFS
ncbi:lytic polysaccharide monooxygenase auxiliary activity family 9 protein [Streptomyces sp. NPDC000151]|uniref:lytic polysaccharide monooxygenase auxiliary activity family 9 protein n=1 Tax=Streptomyces sp. NPDC000151 TaxID=3154244 RepID=UPI0033298EFE